MKPCRVAALWWILLGSFVAEAAQSQPSCTTEDGGLERCVHTRDSLPRFFTLLAERQRLDGFVPEKLAFDRSIALLVGVSNYENANDFSPLPFVRNDVRAMKEYLLGAGGFDEVLCLQDEAVSASTIETLIRKRLASSVGPSDRLLFYFSGHGFDVGGTTGYLAFRSARKGSYDAEAILPVSHLREWASVLRARHVLFVLDSCSSGLGIQAKGLEAMSPDVVLTALAGTGSRAVITAGTGDESAIPSANGESSLFTNALLSILTDPHAGAGYSGFLTAESVFGKLRPDVSARARQRGAKMTPHYWDRLNDDNLRGSFLFLEPARSTMAPDVLSALHARSTSRATKFQRPRKWQDLALRYELQRVSAPRILLDLGRTPAGPRTVPLGVENHFGGMVEISVRPEGGGLNPAFPGGGWSASLPGDGDVDLQLTVDPAQLEPGSHLVVLGEDAPVASLSFRATIVPPSQRVAVDSGPQKSGRRSSFSAPYQLCASAPTPDLELEEGSDRFHLTGDRTCGAWAECRRTVNEPGRVCWEFRLQGHNELLFNDGVRESEAHLLATFRPRPSTITISAQPD